MDELKKVLAAMKKADERWNADEVDDSEEAGPEYAEFLTWAIPIIEKHIAEHGHRLTWP